MYYIILNTEAIDQEDVDKHDLMGLKGEPEGYIMPMHVNISHISAMAKHPTKDITVVNLMGIEYWVQESPLEIIEAMTDILESLEDND